jgi:hypothetical protein
MKATMLSGALRSGNGTGAHPHVDTDFANQLRTPHIYLSRYDNAWLTALRHRQT